MESSDFGLDGLYKVIEPIAPKLSYHNLGHLMDVSKACRKYALMEGLDGAEIRILETAGLLHDIVYIPDRKDNEEKSVYLAKRILPGFGYSARKIEEVSRLILATKLPTKPRDILEKIICDSDLDVLGRDDFFERSELLRQEWNVAREDWYIQQANFLANFGYYTASAQGMRQSKLEENLERLRGLR